MALIATAGKPPHLSRYERDLYEDQIVPTLRKRLEEESRRLSKRISTHSMLSSDQTSIVQMNHTPTMSTPLHRSRTYSSPRRFHTDRQTAQQTPVPRQADSSESHSLPLDSKPPSRIPKPTPRGRSSNPNRHPSGQLTSQDPSNSAYGASYTNTDPKSPTTSGSSSKPNGSARHTDPGKDDVPPQEDRDDHYEHWYRGEGREGGGRNGGRGEILAGTKEMLEIAMGGHPQASYARRRSWRARYEPPLSSPEAESFWGSSRPTSSVPKWEDEYMLDEPPLTDLEADDSATMNDYGPTSSNPSISRPVRIVTPPVSPPPPPPPVLASTSHAPPSPNSKAKSQNHSRLNVGPGHSTSLSNDNISRKRLRKQSTPGPRGVTSRSRSTHDSLSYEGPLADAIPPQPDTYIIPPSGNWDDVILPTVAKKMRLAQGQINDEFTSFMPTLGSRLDERSALHINKARSSETSTPKISSQRTGDMMGEFGMRNSGRETKRLSSFVPTVTVPPEVVNPVSHSTIPAPLSSYPPTKLNGSITPATKRPRDDDENHGGGCCRCVIM